MKKIAISFAINDFSGASKMGYEYALKIISAGHPLVVFIEKSNILSPLANKFRLIKHVKVIDVYGFNKLFSFKLVWKLSKLLKKII